MFCCPVNHSLFYVGFGTIWPSKIGVLGGGLVTQYVSERTLHAVAGIGFIAVGIWTLWCRFSPHAAPLRPDWQCG
jgi:putative Ca2+/H+ antiporter (TMEM165/GDT1 family)